MIAALALFFAQASAASAEDVANEIGEAVETWQEANPDAEPKIDCSDAQTQMKMNICAYRDFEDADKRLNEQWVITSGKMKQADDERGWPEDGRPSYYDALLEAQRAWLAFRDANCRVEGYKLRGGSAEPMEISGCMANMTRARTTELRELIETY